MTDKSTEKSDPRFENKSTLADKFRELTVASQLRIRPQTLDVMAAQKMALELFNEQVIPRIRGAAAQGENATQVFIDEGDIFVTGEECEPALFGVSGMLRGMIFDAGFRVKVKKTHEGHPRGTYYLLVRW